VTVKAWSDANDLEAGERFDDEELCALALSADPCAPLSDDAVPYDQVMGTSTSLLPDWYMARATAVAVSPWRRRVTLAVIAAFLLIDGAGLCSTYGFISWA
jgi:hypothetical protein